MASSLLARLLAAALSLACALPAAAQEAAPPAEAETVTEANTEATTEAAPAATDGDAAQPDDQPDDQPGFHDLIVRIEGAEPTTGTLEITLFNTAENFLLQPYLQTSGPLNEDGSYIARFGKLPPGEYAVVVAHDENGNGKLDAGFLGFGGEGYAFSNDVKPLFGRPGFDEVKFAVTTRTQIIIRLD